MFCDSTNSHPYNIVAISRYLDKKCDIIEFVYYHPALTHTHTHEDIMMF